jgi:farnesyl-diphosphate farnesyltransferase
MLSSFATPKELYSLIKMKLTKGTPQVPNEENLNFCYNMLIRVSRSFATVICELPKELRDAVCVFYLVLRALDTVEDDTKFKDKERKVQLLRQFHQYLEDDDFVIKDCGEKDYKELLLHFPKVIAVYKKLGENYRSIIKNITRQMGEGMADFIDRKTVDSVKDYNLYCYYVAGLVGLGLSEIFIQYGESEELLYPKGTDKEATLSNQMGLFLQKTNIIRDYFEDIEEDRIFWPKEIWSKHANALEDFKYEKNIPKGVECLNELITEAMDQIPACLKYMKLLQNQQIFNFCAIPQVMAIATMAEIYNNPDVFRKNVKIRKGMAARLILETKTVADVEKTFLYFINEIEKKINDKDSNAQRTRAKIQEIKKLISDSGTISEGKSFKSLFATTTVAIATGYLLYHYRDIIVQKLSQWKSTIGHK